MQEQPLSLEPLPNQPVATAQYTRNSSTGDAPRFIAVEGPIGVGKTTLAKKLAATFNYDVLLERAEENPFLERFYRKDGEGALATQLFFLFQRVQQIHDIRQADMFEPVRVADFLIDKDRLFAETNLSSDEFDLYDKVYQQTTIDAPSPDLVIYLQAPVDTLLQRIQQRAVEAERHIDSQYLEKLNNAYCNFFHFYDGAPLLIVNASHIDLVSNEQHYQRLLDTLLNVKSGRHYFNPSILTDANASLW